MQKKLTYSERRRANCRSTRYIPEEQLKEQVMTNKELREENRKPITDEMTAKISLGTQQGKFISEALRLYIAGEEEKFNKYSDRVKEFVKKVYENSLTNNNQAQELMNRIEGKVKDEVIIENKIAKHIPDQASKQRILSKYKEDKPEETIQ
jgi:hypothetical protein